MRKRLAAKHIRHPAPIKAGLGPRLRDARIQAGLSQSELGAPLSRAFVSAVELEKVRPSLASLEHFSSKLGVSVALLVGEDTSSADLLQALTRAAQSLAHASRRNEVERQAHGAATFAIEGALRRVARQRRAS